MGGYIYILANRKKGVLYIGVTNNLGDSGFVGKYGLNRLVYYEELRSIKAAMQREEQLKNRQRERKLSLIESKNKERRDLSSDIG